MFKRLIITLIVLGVVWLVIGNAIMSLGGHAISASESRIIEQGL